MVKGKELSESDRYRAYALTVGKSECVGAAFLLNEHGLRISSAQLGYLRRKFATEGTLKTGKRSGRPPKTLIVGKRHIIRLARHERSTSAKEISRTIGVWEPSAIPLSTPFLFPSQGTSVVARSSTSCMPLEFATGVARKWLFCA